MNSSVLRCLIHPLSGLAVAAAMVGVPAATASAASVPTVHSENYYCDWESGYGCESYGYHSYPTDSGRDYGHGDGGYYSHGRHHHY